MSLRMRDAMTRMVGELRYEPTEKRLRAMVGDHTVLDCTRAMLVWEPRRIIPAFAVPIEDVRGEVVGAPGGEDPPPSPILHPGIPFSVHSTAGESLSLEVAGETREAAAFRPEDPELAGYVVLDFHAFDAWYEEDELLVGHARDPYHRIDVRESSRHVRIELDGELLAESRHPYLLFETHLPVRFYLQPSDLRVPSRPAERRSYCAYKGEASYLALELNDELRDDLVWTYPQPSRDVAVLTNRVAFYDEKVDVVVDGQRRERPASRYSKAVVEEAGR